MRSERTTGTLRIIELTDPKLPIEEVMPEVGDALNPNVPLNKIIPGCPSLASGDVPPEIEEESN